ncbi:hypothetical protein SERLA73DRAFT_176052, partial [Serpula lacrymans var. lacrymans S7.3]
GTIQSFFLYVHLKCPINTALPKHTKTPRNPALSSSSSRTVKNQYSAPKASTHRPKKPPPPRHTPSDRQESINKYHQETPKQYKYINTPR